MKLFAVMSFVVCVSMVMAFAGFMAGAAVEWRACVMQVSR